MGARCHMFENPQTANEVDRDTTTLTRNPIWLALVLLLGSSVFQAQDVQSVYSKNCAHCHGADGRGNTPLGRELKLPSLRSARVANLPEEDLFVTIAKGAVDGKMPGFRKKLGDETVQQLATFVHDFNNQPEPTAVSTGPAKAKSTAGDVKATYSAKCAHCHGEDGSGNTVLGREMKIRDWSSAIAKSSDAELSSIIAHGTDGGRMPGFQKKLGPDMVDEVARYVRTSWGSSCVTSNESTLPTAASLNQQLTEPSGQTQAVSVSLDSKSDNLRSSENIVKSEQVPKSDDAGSSLKKRESAKVIDLNSASKETLMTLPGLTEQDVDNIIKARPYKSTLQFKISGVITPESYEQIAGRVVAKRPPKTKAHREQE